MHEQLRQWTRHGERMLNLPPLETWDPEAADILSEIALAYQTHAIFPNKITDKLRTVIALSQAA